MVRDGGILFLFKQVTIGRDVPTNSIVHSHTHIAYPDCLHYPDYALR